MNEDLIREYADKLIAAVQAASGPTAEAALLYAWSDALGTIVFGLIFLALFGAALVFAWRIWLPWALEPPADVLSDKPFEVGFSAVGLGVLLFALVRAASETFHVTAWVALWHPEIWLIHEALK